MQILVMLRLLWGLLLSAWTTPITITPGDVASASNHNTYIRDNLTYLLSRPNSVIRRDNGADYTTTSTSFVDIDSTNLAISLTISGTSILIGFSGATGTITTTPVSFDFTVDGVRVGASGNDGMGNQIANSPILVSLVTLVTGLTPGSHTIKIQWRNRGGNSSILFGGSGTNDKDSIPMLWAQEIA